MGGLFSGIVMPPAGKVNALEGPGTDRKKLAGAWGGAGQCSLPKKLFRQAEALFEPLKRVQKVV